MVFLKFEIKMKIKKDILSRADIELLVNRFYDKVKQDAILGYLFNDVAKTNWQVHLPKMYDFWEVVLFAKGSFKGNPMLVHRQLHEKSALSEAHFNHWLVIFKETVDELFEGENAENIKYSAANIAGNLMYKLLSV